VEIKVIVSDIDKIKAGAIIVNFFEGVEHLDGDIATIDKALDGAISQLISPVSYTHLTLPTSDLV